MFDKIRLIMYRQALQRRYLFWSRALDRALTWSRRWFNLGWLQANRANRLHLMDCGEDCLALLDTKALLVVSATCRSLRGLVAQHLMQERSRALRDICIAGVAP